MIDVTNQNFNKIYPHLERALKDANFIAIDTELTAYSTPQMNVIRNKGATFNRM